MIVQSVQILLYLQKIDANVLLQNFEQEVEEQKVEETCLHLTFE